MKAPQINILPPETSEVPVVEKEAIGRIKNWVKMICRNKCTAESDIFISPLRYENHEGKVISKTIICVCDNLPDGPVVQIGKDITEVGLEDLLGCYKLLNYCKGDSKE